MADTSPNDKIETKEYLLDTDQANNNNGNINIKEKDFTLGDVNMVLETKLEKRRRQISLWIVYFTTFIQSLGFSIILTGVWPYLTQLEKEPHKELLGWVIAANPIGQLIFSPLIGWFCTFLNSIRLPSIFCLFVFIVSNVWYALLPLHQENAQYFMMFARFLVGISSGSIAACRTFVTQETLLKERTPSIAYLSLFQGVGFTVGPALQVLLTGLGEEGIPLWGKLTLSMYTGAGWIAAILGLINIVLYHPKLLYESNVAAKEYAMKNKSSGLDEGHTYKQEDFKWSQLRPDYVALFVLVVAFFVMLFNFSLLETLAAPVIMDQFGWSSKQAVRNLGIAMTISSTFSIFLFFSVGYLSRRFDERKLLVFCGIIPMLIGRVFFFSFPGPVAPMRKLGCLLPPTNLEISYNQTLCSSLGLDWVEVQHGCPAEQEWCFNIPALTPTMVVIGFVFGAIGYPYCVTIPQTLYSKVLGPRPQGTWNGLLSGVVSLAKIIGSVFLVYIYQNFGTNATSSLATGLLVVALALILAFYRRLTPFKVPDLV